MSTAAKTRKGEAVDGILLLNKPSGLTSNRALQQVKRLLRARKAGHTGSLDPAATGMLPLCFGEATKVCAFLLNADKTYRVTAKLGIATDTGDADGQPTATAAVPALDRDEWDDILQGFVGDSSQVPPMYSALKKNGRRLYELARRGETVERDARPVRIDSIELLELAQSRLVFRVRCSKGTYVRSLVEDIAGRADTLAHTARLHRESVAGFETSAMTDLAAAEALAETDRNALLEKLIAPDAALRTMPSVHVDEEAAARFRRGQAVSADRQAADGLVRVYASRGAQDFLGVGLASGAGIVAPKRVFLQS